MADKKSEDDGTAAKDNKHGRLDSGPSQPGDSREATATEPNLNEPGADFSHLKGTEADNPDLPLDNTPAGKALGHSDGRPMSQTVGVEEIALKDDPSQQDNPTK